MLLNINKGMSVQGTNTAISSNYHSFNSAKFANVYNGIGNGSQQSTFSRMLETNTINANAHRDISVNTGNEHGSVSKIYHIDDDANSKQAKNTDQEFASNTTDKAENSDVQKQSKASEEIADKVNSKGEEQAKDIDADKDTRKANKLAKQKNQALSKEEANNLENLFVAHDSIKFSKKRSNDTLREQDKEAELLTDKFKAKSVEDADGQQSEQELASSKNTEAHMFQAQNSGLTLENTKKQKGLQNTADKTALIKRAELSHQSLEEVKAIESNTDAATEIKNGKSAEQKFKGMLQDMQVESKPSASSEVAETRNEAASDDTTSLEAKLFKSDKITTLEKPVEKVVSFMKSTGNNELVQQAKLIFKGNQKGQIKIMLNPKEFGEIKMSFNIDNEKIVGKIIVSSEIARDAMQKNMDNLARQFSFEGYEVEGFFVSVDSNNSEKNNEGQFKKQFVANRDLEDITDMSNELLLQNYIGPTYEIIDFVT